MPVGGRGIHPGGPKSWTENGSIWSLGILPNTEMRQPETEWEEEKQFHTISYYAILKYQWLIYHVIFCNFQGSHMIMYTNWRDFSYHEASAQITPKSFDSGPKETPTGTQIDGGLGRMLEKKQWWAEVKQQEISSFKCMCIKKCWNHIYIYVYVYIPYFHDISWHPKKNSWHTQFRNIILNTLEYIFAQYQHHWMSVPTTGRASREGHKWDAGIWYFTTKGSSAVPKAWCFTGGDCLKVPGDFHNIHILPNRYSTSSTLTSFEWNKKWIKSAPTSRTIAKKLL